MNFAMIKSLEFDYKDPFITSMYTEVIAVLSGNQCLYNYRSHGAHKWSPLLVYEFSSAIL